MSVPKAAGDQAMNSLQNKWYNTLVKGLSLDESSFQLVQASEPVGSSTKNLWDVFDSVPPKSLTQVLTPSKFNSFSDDYRAVVTTINPQGGEEWRRVMGDDLDKWVSYKKEHADQVIAKGLDNAFEEWAKVYLEDQRANKAITAYMQMQHGVVREAMNDAFDPQYRRDGQKNGQPVFSRNVQDLRQALASGESRSVSFDSKSASSDVSHTWAKGNVGGAYEFFSASASGSYDHLSKKASSSRVTVDASFDSVVTFDASPGGWFNSDALNLAYNTKDNTVWPAGQKPTWETTFGANGNLTRIASAVVAVDGIDATITSHASYSESERTEIKSEASMSYWPFVSFDASGGHETSTSFEDDGSMKVEMNVPKGNPHILGVNVLPIDQALGGQ